MEYYHALQLVKSTFLDGSEKRMLVDYIRDHFSRINHLQILDVGIGDGRYIGKIVHDLSHYHQYSVNVTGIDPSPESQKFNTQLYPSFRIIPRHFEYFETSLTYDVVVATHSLYYLKQPEQCIEKMVRFTKKGGLLIFVLWSEQCVLSKLYRPCRECGPYYTSANLMRAETAYQYLQSIPEVKDAHIMYFPGRVDFMMWKAIPETLTSACMVFSRGNESKSPNPLQVEHVRMLLDHCNNIESRINGVIVVQK